MTEEKQWHSIYGDCFGGPYYPRHCKHLITAGRCAAFKEIPLDISNGYVKHDKPYPGDNGIQFEPIPPFESEEERQQLIYKIEEMLGFTKYDDSMFTEICKKARASKNPNT